MTPSPLLYDISDTRAPQANKRSTWITIGAIAVGVALIAGVLLWQGHRISSLQGQVKNLAPVVNDQYGSTVVMDVAAGVLTSTSPAHPVLTTLVLPSNNFIVNTGFSSNDPAELSSHYVTDSTQVLAAWSYAVPGTRALPSAGTQVPFTVSDLAAWLKTNDPEQTFYGLNAPVSTTAMTAAQKASWLTTVKRETSACTANPTTGFATASGTFKFCYTLPHPQALGAPWSMAVFGIGTVDGHAIYARGNFGVNATWNGTNQLPNPAVYAPLLSALKSFSVENSN